ncbi:MAG: lipoprotein NlpI [Firmicutes bacterium]|nr:lipoprotein NlpI [Bacillota bacterium]
MNPKLFISYSWKNKNFVDELDYDFKKIGITLTRDIRDAPDYKSLSSFMKSIRECDYAILIISDEYLKSYNCLYEIIEFLQEKNFEERILE